MWERLKPKPGAVNTGGVATTIQKTLLVHGADKQADMVLPGGVSFQKGIVDIYLVIALLMAINTLQTEPISKPSVAIHDEGYMLGQGLAFQEMLS